MIFLEHGVFESGFEVVVFCLVEAVHIELPDEAVDFVVSEVFREDYFLEFGNVLDSELKAIVGPVDDFVIVSNLHSMRFIGTLRISKVLATKPAIY